MKSLVWAGLTLATSVSMAVTETTTGTLGGFNETAVTASSRSEALITNSRYYSLPQMNMTHMELGVSNQRQQFENGPEQNTRLNHQSFFFNHSRGLNEILALDVHLDYAIRDEDSIQGSTGVNDLQVGIRSHFNAMAMQWIYGGSIGYLPQGELHEPDSKAVVTARLGFEETVDIARWGLEMVGTTQNSLYFDNQLNLQGFFEMPFVRRFEVGVSAGADLTHLTSSESNNFAGVYGDFAIDPVSSARLSLQQNNEAQDDQSFSQAEVGLALTRVF